jgi:hypothetical protein
MAEPANDVDKAKRDRYLYVMALLVGQRGEADVLDPKQPAVSGILHTSTPFADLPHRIVLKGARAVDEGDPRATAPASTAILDAKKVRLLTVRCPRVVGDPRSSGFRTDGDIARPDRKLAGRKLEAVDNSWLTAPKIKSQPARGTPGKKWDQFEANARLFGTKSEFNENNYTTALDASALTPQQRSAAEKLAREIEGAKTDNIHLAEERGHDIGDDMDEEDRFSGVVRSAPGAKTPPPGLGPDAKKTAVPEEKPAPKKAPTKLSATAKEFTFNVAASEFTPSFAPPPPPGPPPMMPAFVMGPDGLMYPAPQPMYDPYGAMPMYGAPMYPGAYMPPPRGGPGAPMPYLQPSGMVYGAPPPRGASYGGRGRGGGERRQRGYSGGKGSS